MRTILTVLLFVILSGVLPAAGWELMIQGPVTIKGTGEITVVTPPGGPAVPPPPEPSPPVVIPPPPPPAPAVDRSPFVPPNNCSSRQASADERARWAWAFPGDFASFYSMIDGAGNPLPQSHTCAGVIARGAVAEDGRTTVGETQLWVPRAALTGHPWDIRCVLATGRRC